MSGFEATRKLTSSPETRDIPVIILTDKVCAERQGASDFFIKPPNGAELLEQVQSLLG